MEHYNRQIVYGDLYSLLPLMRFFECQDTNTCQGYVSRCRSIGVSHCARTEVIPTVLAEVYPSREQVRHHWHAVAVPLEFTPLS